MSKVYEGEGGIRAEVVAHSIGETAGSRPIITYQLRYPRFIHSELMTHRQFSRNASSSRAIPVSKKLREVADKPASPIHWGKNQPGMQASEELKGKDLTTAKRIWVEASRYISVKAHELMELAAHKQIANRLLEPFTFINVLVTSTEWTNWFNLRLHSEAQPEIQELASCMRDALLDSDPEVLIPGRWHAPYIEGGYVDNETWCLASAARCARVSYQNHDKTDPILSKDLELAKMLLTGGHMSPFEHIATPIETLKGSPASEWEDGVTHMSRDGSLWSGNFKGFIQFRQTLPGGSV